MSLNSLDMFLMSHAVLMFSSQNGPREGSFLVLLVRILVMLITIGCYDLSRNEILFINEIYDSFTTFDLNNMILLKFFILHL